MRWRQIKRIVNEKEKKMEKIFLCIFFVGRVWKFNTDRHDLNALCESEYSLFQTLGSDYFSGDPVGHLVEEVDHT